METLSLPLVSAVWFGILTSISPCPLATNIAATTYLGKQIESRYGPLLAGVGYTFGRTLAYVAICLLIVGGLFSIPGVSMFLQQQMNRILGPILIVAGLLILGVVPLRMPNFGFSGEFTQRLGRQGFFGAIFLGFLFALSFCPISAALFFGSVIPLAINYQSGILMPLFYGIGTAAPVIAFALLLAFGTRFAARFVRGLTAMEKHLRRLTAVVFIGIGIYFTLKYLLEVL